VLIRHQCTESLHTAAGPGDDQAVGRGVITHAEFQRQAVEILAPRTGDHEAGQHRFAEVETSHRADGAAVRCGSDQFGDDEITRAVVVAKQPVLVDMARGEQIDGPVAVVVGPAHAEVVADELAREVQRGADVAEGAVAVAVPHDVAIAVEIVVRDEDVEPAIVVEVVEGNRARVVMAAHAGCCGHIAEGAVTEVAIELTTRYGVSPHVDVAPAIVVVIAHVEAVAAAAVSETSRRGGLDEPT